MSATELKVRVELTPLSMFSSTPAYQVQAELDAGKEDVVVFGQKRDAVVPDSSDILYTVPSSGHGRLDLISQKFYDVPDLWWAISRCNPSMDPMIGPSVADVIRIPTRARLATLGILSA